MLGYRADIDGLRAIAVLSVLFFHVDISLFGGGFVGVDVFFTISGFLITSILLKAKQTEKFSFLEFYKRRALRIIPAYIVLVLLTTIAGFVILAPLAFKELLESTIASSLFASNFYFLFTLGGYFSAAAHELPLLHTWSLSVEEQFYLIMPLAVVLWFKIAGETKRLWLLFGVFFVSVVVSIVLTHLHQKAAYFVVFSRAHEFLIGSLLSVLLMKYGARITPNKVISNIVFLFSFAALVVSTIFIDAKSAFPGYLALIPCVATILTIYCGLNKHCFSHVLLGNRLMVFIGLLSYSLYLYHWPIVAYAKYMGVEFTILVQVLIVVASFVFAYISWRFVENKVRYFNWKNQNAFALNLYLLPGLALISFYIYSNYKDFYPFRFDSKVAYIEKVVTSKPESGREACHSSSLDISGLNHCKLGDNEAQQKAILWGDSHANHFVGFMDEVGTKVGLRITDITMGNCPPLLNVNISAPGAGKRCSDKNIAVLNYVKDNKPDFVYLAGSWAGYMGQYIQANNQDEKVAKVVDSLTLLIAELQENDIKVVFFEMLPRAYKGISSCSLKSEMYPFFNSLDNCHFDNSNFYYGEQQQIYQRLKQEFGASLEMISLDELICTNGMCKSYVGNLPLYRDSNHLNMYGSKLLGQMYLKNIGY